MRRATPTIIAYCRRAYPSTAVVGLAAGIAGCFAVAATPGRKMAKTARQTPYAARTPAANDAKTAQISMIESPIEFHPSIRKCGGASILCARASV
ncbi:MAG TPA: hypothetical protein VGU23_01300 [Acidobacteriaceae bacterium]|nr:hypothetical protein [Acidobacteriaceae bacterium]